MLSQCSFNSSRLHWKPEWLNNWGEVTSLWRSELHSRHASRQTKTSLWSQNRTLLIKPGQGCIYIYIFRCVLSLFHSRNEQMNKSIKVQNMQVKRRSFQHMYQNNIYIISLRWSVTCPDGWGMEGVTIYTECRDNTQEVGLHLKAKIKCGNKKHTSSKWKD